MVERCDPFFKPGTIGRTMIKPGHFEISHVTEAIQPKGLVIGSSFLGRPPWITPALHNDHLDVLPNLIERSFPMRQRCFNRRITPSVAALVGDVKISAHQEQDRKS